jgi:hypothetical protein
MPLVLINNLRFKEEISLYKNTIRLSEGVKNKANIAAIKFLVNINKLEDKLKSNLGGYIYIIKIN